jgi:hypothetical protein
LLKGLIENCLSGEAVTLKAEPFKADNGQLGRLFQHWELSGQVYMERPSVSMRHNNVSILIRN